MPDNHDAAIPPTVDNSLEIGYIPPDVLLLIFYSLHGQDIVRCIRVCRSFAALIHSDLYLQYKIELAQNGMVEGDSSALSTSERLRRLRQYSSNFRNGIFDRGEGHMELPDYILDRHNTECSSRMPSYHDSSFPTFHLEFDQPEGRFLHAFTHGSAQAGIQPRRWFVPVSSQLGTTKWAVDDSQDLLVIAGVSVPPPDTREWFIEIQFLSLDGSTTTMTAHPVASRPSIRVRPVEASEVEREMVVQLAISGKYAICEFSDPQDGSSDYTIEVFNWKTGQMIWRIAVGRWPVHIIPLDHPYLLVLPNVKPYPEFSIYTFAPSAPSSRSLVCTLQLPELHLAQHISWHDICTSRRPLPRSGHFRADPAHWMVAFALYTGLGRHRFTSHLLIPRATLSAQIRAAEARQQLAIERARGEGGLGGEASVLGPVSVPWQDWGPRGCLRLRLLRTPFSGILRLVPFGSRMPFVVFDPPTTKSRSVYVFDLNPLVVRHARQSLSGSSPSPSRGDAYGSSDGGLAGAGAGAIRVVEDVEAALPGVVDPGCSAIPYVVYRFDVPERLEIRSVVMSMTGFMVLSDDPEAEKAWQTWTV